MTDTDWDALWTASARMTVYTSELMTGQQLHPHGMAWRGCPLCDRAHRAMLDVYGEMQQRLGPVGGLQRRLGAAAASTAAPGVEEATHRDDE